MGLDPHCTLIQILAEFGPHKINADPAIGTSNLDKIPKLQI
jgi:hypothetical protein